MCWEVDTGMAHSHSAQGFKFIFLFQVLMAGFNMFAIMPRLMDNICSFHFYFGKVMI